MDSLRIDHRTICPDCGKKEVLPQRFNPNKLVCHWCKWVGPNEKWIPEKKL